jgi:UDP-galactopyranose mutase
MSHYTRRVPERVDTLVVGAGFAGAVVAERLHTVLGQRVLLIDQRDHIGGNAHDCTDEHGVLIHRYGPHIFHTNSELVVDYLSQFTDWRPYEHRVLARVDGQLLPIPINRTTINRLYGLRLRTDDEVERFYAERREPLAVTNTSEDAVLAKVGRDLYEKFFRGYSRKQWGRDPSQLHATVCGRIPTRTNEDDRYFADSFQQMPADGFTRMFERMLAGVEVRLGTDFLELDGSVEYDHLVFSGPIDAFFGYRFGRLPYRSLEFETQVHATPDGELVQPVAVLNHPALDVDYTRVTEYRHLTGQQHTFSTLHIEYPKGDGDPFYPIPSDDTRALYKRYERLAAELANVTFVGRLARYQYLNMDQVVAQALSAFDKLAERLERPTLSTRAR